MLRTFSALERGLSMRKLLLRFKKKCKDAPSQPSTSKKRLDEDESRSQRPSRRPESRFSSYTPLNSSLEQILLEIQDKKLLIWPSCMKTDAGQRDKRKYCRFHRDHGYNTIDFVNLKAEIENLIPKGHLRQYIKEEKQARKDEQLSRAADDGTEIRTIYGGPSKGGDSNQARKAHARSTDPEHYIHLTDKSSKEPQMSPCSLTFIEDDARGIQHPHDDALVVTMMIANWKVYRILVDTRSSADILYSEAFDKMGINRLCL
ncbi:uncharacterized protein LOC131224326 [Magnolia sinica]|uniref:uncharacterized protein LOC131224326 n=1 Tax=Magnolia sinica TaxID=86752 RepID=UPI00265AB4F0|nr:uncharacterized protein LOC131224326 [Magnolia sinica]